MLNVFYDSYNILTKVYGGAYLKQALNDTVIEEKNRAQTEKICYGVLDKDVTLEYCISYLCEKRPKSAIRILLKISMYCIKYLGNAPYAVVDNCVELAKKLGKGGAAGFVNAFLRKFSKEDIPMPTDKIKNYSVTYSYPEFAVKMLIEDYGEERAVEIMKADTERTTLRFNVSVSGFDYLTERNCQFEETPFKNTYIVKNFKRNSDYDKGMYTFQSVGSAAICDLVGSGENLLDACAAPGGKSVNLSDKFSSVTSFDVHPHRVRLIEEYARRMGKENITAVLADSSVFNEEYRERFDVVLADVPCSGYGVIKDNPDIKLRRTKENIEELCINQYAILDNVASYVKKGGYLCYSTCSVFAVENVDICKKFLKNHSDFEEVKCTSKLEHLRTEIGLQFLPNLSLGAGFYFCKFKKL